MNKSDVIKSTIAIILAGVSIYGLKKREEKIFQQEYKDLREEYKAELEKVSKAYKSE